MPRPVVPIFPCPRFFFRPLIHGPMVWQNKVRLFGEMKSSPCSDFSSSQALNLFHQPDWVHNSSSRNQAGNIRPQNSRGDQMQNIFFFSDLHRVTRVVSPLCSQDPIRLRCHYIQNFSLSLIPPLKAQNDRDARLQRPTLVYSNPRDFISVGLRRFRPSKIRGVRMDCLILRQSSKRYSGHSVATISTSAPSAT